MKLHVFKSEQGSILVEQLVSAAILIMAFTFATRSITGLMGVQARSKASPVLFENDQLLRYEIDRLLSSMQRRITEQALAVQCLPATPPALDTFKQVAEESLVAQTLAFGIPSELIANPNPFVQKVFASINLLRNHMALPGLDAMSQKSTQMLADAYRRCSNEQSIKSGQNLRNRNSIYFCAFGESVIAEIKATFWDFNNATPLTCSTMNEKPGRGFQVVYSAYVFTPNANVSNKLKYSVKKADGRLYVTKDVLGMSN